MEHPPTSYLPTPDEPEWPTGEGPYLFVTEVSGPFERRLLRDWLRRTRPGDVVASDVQVAELPVTRRTPRRRRPDPAFKAFLSADADALVVPVRVVWLTPERGGIRHTRITDLLSVGDPRDPGVVNQYVIYSRYPERVRIICGEPERLATLREAWNAPEARREGRSFAELVARRAWLTLESRERQLRGTRYKVPKFPRETLLDNQEFQAGVARLARRDGVSYGRMAARTRRYVREMAATHSPWMIDLVTSGYRQLIRRAYVELDYDPEELKALYQMAQRYPLVFLPTHKSHFDHQSLQFALYENDLPPNHTAGGINMNFFPVGPLIRRSGVFFIRREFRDNEPYKFVLRRYADYLLQRRFPVEWYIEGTRSRTGKLLPPRLGMLAYVVEAYQRGAADDVIFVPVAIAYDQIQDVRSYAAEQTGAPKPPETLGWMLRAIRGLQRPYGGIHLRLGRPISLRTFFTELGEDPPGADDTRSPAIPKLAFEISNRINEAMPITPISLVTLVMLADGGEMAFDAICDAVAPYAAEAERRNLPSTIKEPLGSRDVLGGAVDELVVHDIVDRIADGATIRFRIASHAELAAAYYRNTVVHFWLVGAIAELAVASLGGDESDPVAALQSEAMEMRELLLFDFFFPSRSVFDEEVEAELTDRLPDWKERLAAGDVAAVVESFRPFRSPAVLRSFLEAYRVVGDLIAEDAFMNSLDDKDLVARGLVLGTGYVEDGVIFSEESVSKILYETAVKLADHRELLGPGPDVVERRKAFATQLRELCERIAGLA